MMSRKRGTKTGKYAGSTAVSSMKAMAWPRPWSRGGGPARPCGASRWTAAPPSPARYARHSRSGRPRASPRAPRLWPGPRRRIARVLDDQDRPRVALDEAHALRLLDVSPGEIEDHLVRELDRVGTRLQDGLRRLEGLLDVVVVDHVDGGGLGARHEAHLGFDDGEERPSEPTTRRAMLSGRSFTSSSRL